MSLDLAYHDRFRRTKCLPDEFVGSLDGFRHLKHIRVNSAMFIEKYTEEEEHQLRQELHEERLGAERRRVHPLKDVLPSSVNSLNLTAGTRNNVARRLLEGLPECKPSKFPNVDSITSETVGPSAGVRLGKEMTEACKDAGIGLVGAMEEL